MLAINTVKKYFPKVTKVVDGTDVIDLEVLENDCKYGIEGDPRSCAFARALQRDHNGALVGIKTCYVVDGEVAKRYRHRQSKKLKQFDKGIGKLTPGIIKLTPFMGRERLGKGHSTNVHKVPTGKKQAFHHAVAQEDRTGVRVL